MVKFAFNTVLKYSLNMVAESGGWSTPWGSVHSVTDETLERALRVKRQLQSTQPERKSTSRYSNKPNNAKLKFLYSGNAHSKF